MNIEHSDDRFNALDNDQLKSLIPKEIDRLPLGYRASSGSVSSRIARHIKTFIAEDKVKSKPTNNKRWTYKDVLYAVKALGEDNEDFNPQQKSSILDGLTKFAAKGQSTFKEEEVQILIEDALEEGFVYLVEKKWQEFNKELPNILDWGLFNIDTFKHAKIHYFNSIGQISERCLFLDKIYVGMLLGDKNICRADLGFDSIFDPVSQYEVIKEGKVGTLLGINVYTDAYLPTNKRFIKGIHLRYKEKDVQSMERSV